MKNLGFRSALMLSVLLHTAAIIFIGQQEAKVHEGGRFLNKTVTARIVINSDVVASTDVYARQRNFGQRTKGHEFFVREPQREVLPRQIADVSRGSPSLPVLSESVLAKAESESDGQNREVPSILADTFAPCRALVLPDSWLRMPNLFPRRYNIEFSLFDFSRARSFKVLKLLPEGEELPYADRLIKTSFENCVNELGQEHLVELQERFQALNPTPGDAYSFRIEFETARTQAGPNKGI